MKELKQILSPVNTYRTADTINHEGFTAWTPSGAQLLEQMAMTGTMSTSFYAAVKETTEDAIQLLERANAEDLAKAIVKGRNEGFIRTFPILGLVYLSKKSPVLFRQVFEQVILTGNDLGDFIDLVHKTRGFGRSIKAAIHGWLDKKVTPYYAMKYRKDIADAIRVSRFKGTDPLYAFVLSIYPDVKGVTPEKLAAAEERYPELHARRLFINTIEGGYTEIAAHILTGNRLDTDCLTNWYDKFDVKVWQQVARLSPVMKFLKYLDKFTREGVDVTKMAQEKITVENLRKAKVFPFRLYTAMKALQLSGCNEGPVIDRLSHVLDEYARQYDWGVFNRYSWAICPDVSGSMTWGHVGKSNLTPAELSAMFVGFFMKGLENVMVLPWDTRVYHYMLGASDSVMNHMAAVRDMAGGGTHMEVAVNYMLMHQIYNDFTVFLTDTEEYGVGWLDAWKKYHRRFPKAKAFLLRTDSYGTSPVPEDAARNLGIYQIFGWNDNVVNFMRYVLETQK